MNQKPVSATRVKNARSGQPERTLLSNAVGHDSAEHGDSPANDPDSDGLSPINAMSLRDQAHGAIRAGIISGNIEAGAILSVRALASRLGVSVTPVREAVLDLVNEGLLLTIRNRGYQVPMLSDQDLEEILDLRVLLEVPSMVRLAGRLPEARIAHFWALATAIQESAAVDDIVGFLEGDREFHLSLLNELGNPRLTDSVALLRDQVRLYGVPYLAEEHQLSDSAQEHASLLQALERGDARLTEQLMTHHLQHTRGIWAGESDREHGVGLA